MRAGDITVDGRHVGFIEINLPDTAEHLTPFVGDYNPSGRAEDSDTGKGFHHHGVGHSRPSHDQGHDHPAPGHRHGPGHFPRGEAREKDHRDQLGDVPYSSSGNPFDRSRFAKELADKPGLRERLAHISLGENQDPRANAAVLETMMNRAIVRGTSLEAQAQRHRSSGVDEQGYYAGWAPHYSDEKRAMFERNLGAALRGSNITAYATDNSSGSLAARERASGAFRHHTTINGESFFSPGHAQPALRDKWQQLNARAQEHERAKDASNPMPTQTAPMFVPSSGGEFEGIPELGEQFTGAPGWGKPRGAWREMRHAPIEDRRADPTKGHTTQELNEAKLNQVRGFLEMMAAKEGESTPLAREAGIDDLAKPDLAKPADPFANIRDPTKPETDQTK